MIINYITATASELKGGGSHVTEINVHIYHVLQCSVNCSPEHTNVFHRRYVRAE